MVMEQALVDQGLEEAQAQDPEEALVEDLEEVQVKDPEEAQAEVLVEEPVEEEEQERVPAGTAYVLHVVHKYCTGREPRVHP